ncbi:M61 family metallopeptidase [Sphingomonas bacterium]|uniref:M61 family metallopeptidase n=1 Tax=Sphingomonas bacterium TaxID=1895847 RepID=UPI0015776CC8|nr:M61 family metallopeptidase [Sphingomonas bacterium]
MNVRLVAALLASTIAAATQAQVPAGNSAPQPLPFANAIPEPQDVMYPGTIELAVDATNTGQGIFTAHETIPVAKPGPMVLLYPKWLPGNHSPTGQIDKLAGLFIRANGKLIAWTRDPVDVYAFHIDVPQGARKIEIDLQFLSATKPEQGAMVMGKDILRLQWNSVSLYPAGYFTRDIPISATVRYPQGFAAASGLPSRANGANYAYQTTNYEVLVDSPTIAGRYYKPIALSPNVTLDTFADNAEQLATTPAQVDAHKRLVDQAVKTFGAQHYDNYHFLFGISEEIGGIGLEHHRSSEDGVRPGYFTEWDMQTGARNLLPHEYSHSWDGKFRRGADLWTPNFDVPMRDSLLWVYEGQTQFWGYVLQTRSGLVSKQDTLDQYASIMASYDAAPARQWRDLVDTTNDPIISQRRPKGWTSWQRSEDYYNEGLLVWIDVDSLLREKSGGTKSIDDFARAFFGMRNGDYGELTYTFDDVAATLNGIVPYDWAGYLHQRLTEHASGAPIEGFARNGYRLVYTDTPTKSFKQGEKSRKIADLTYSGGLIVNATGDITGVTWNGAAFKAGLDVGTTIVAVGDMAYSDDRLKAAITAAKTSKEPVKLTVRSGDTYRMVAVDWHQGLRYPHLEKIGIGDGGLDLLLAPRP